MKRIWVVFLLILCAGRAFALPLEWLLVRGGVRDCLVATLEAEERFDELDFLEAVWEGDAEGAEAAARVLVDRAHDPEMTRWLARYLRRTSRADEAARIAPRPRKLLSTVPTSGKPEATSRRPVVFLHGYNGSAETWKDFVRVFGTAGYAKDDMLVFNYEAMFGADEDTPIESLAEKVEPRVRSWLRWRAGLPADDSSHDADLPVPDWVCHSMGGLVFRVVLKNAPGLVHRCVTLGTPHFGQAIGDYEIVADLAGDQTEQMSHGSSFLWKLAADWHYLGHRTDDILFIVGAAMTDLYLDFEDELAQDGLVNTFSATMLTQADGAAFAARTFFVDRIHSSSLEFLDYFGLASGVSLVSLPGASQDPVFKLVHGYLNDTDYFADGAVPSQRQVMADDGLTESDQNEVLRRVYGHGALFVQVMEPVTNTAKRVQTPIEYVPPYWWLPFDTPDNVVDELHWNGHEYTGDHDGLIRSSGSGGESCKNGLVLLYGNIPTGTVSVTVGEPYEYEGPYRFGYRDTAVIYGGGTTLWRTRPGAVKPMSAVSVADGSGRTRTLVVSNSWLEAAGLVTSAEDLKGCVTAASVTGANGYPAALSALLGLDPSDPASQVRFDGIGVSNETVELSLLAGDRPLPRDAPFVLQGNAGLSDDWRDLDDVVRLPGFWTVPPSSNRFFRAAFRW